MIEFRLALLACAFGMIAVSPALRAADNSDPIERGHYLVDEVAKCGECHTPMDEKGELDRSQWLKGATLNFAPIRAVERWHKAAPDLTSSGRLFERWGEKGLIAFLTTGKGPSGHPAGPPMPTYHLKQEDAEAVVAYLKSLK